MLFSKKTKKVGKLLDSRKIWQLLQKGKTFWENQEKSGFFQFLEKLPLFQFFGKSSKKEKSLAMCENTNNRPEEKVINPF
jgi:hypothetical protein